MSVSCLLFDIRLFIMCKDEKRGEGLKIIDDFSYY